MRCEIGPRCAVNGKTLFWLVLLFCSTGATNFPRGAARGRTDPTTSLPNGVTPDTVPGPANFPMLVCHELLDMLLTVNVVNQMLVKRAK
jgi:hypothetical protein